MFGGKRERAPFRHATGPIMPTPLLVKDAVYVSHASVYELDARGDEDYIIQIGDMISYSSTTGLKPTDNLKGFQFVNVTQGRRIQLTPDDLLAVLGMDE